MFGPKSAMKQVQIQKVELRGFDSASDIAESVKTVVGSVEREMQSFVEYCRQNALLIISSLVETITESKLDADELPTDCFDDLILEVLEGSDESDSTLEDGLAAALHDAFSTFGVDDSIIEEIFSDNVEAADAAIEAAAETVLANLPDDGDPMDEFVREFIYGEPDEAGFDAATGKKLSRGQMSTKSFNGKNIRYKAVAAIRNGIKTVVNKRLPGQKVRLSAGQRAATKKARMKAVTANALNKRMRSLSKGRKAGLYK